MKEYFVHPSSDVEEGSEIGSGTKIWRFSHVLPGSKIGKNCVIGQNVMVGPEVSVGNRCKIQNNVSVYKGVILEDDVFCGPSMVFTNVMNPRAHIERKDDFKETLVKKGASIGANATVLAGNVLGRYSVVGAGSVVTKDIEDHSVVVGIPAKQVAWACECGDLLTKEIDFSGERNLKCDRCGLSYTQKGRKLERVM